MPVQIIDKENKKVGEVELLKTSLDKTNKAVLYYALKAQLNNLRHGKASTKDRSEVNKTTKKTYRQKGTGNARHGARSVNIFVGGGVTHGPRPHSFVEKINKKFKKTSYREVFKFLIQTEGLKIINELNFEKPSTKHALTILKNLKLKKALVILPNDNINAQLSFRNIKDVFVVSENNINIYDLIRSENVILTANYFEKLKERYCI